MSEKPENEEPELVDDDPADHCESCGSTKWEYLGGADRGNLVEEAWRCLTCGHTWTVIEK